MSAGRYKVADINLAAFGRKETQLAEHEMPGPPRRGLTSITGAIVNVFTVVVSGRE